MLPTLLMTISAPPTEAKRMRARAHTAGTWANLPMDSLPVEADCGSTSVVANGVVYASLDDSASKECEAGGSSGEASLASFSAGLSGRAGVIVGNGGGAERPKAARALTSMRPTPRKVSHFGPLRSPVFESVNVDSEASEERKSEERLKRVRGTDSARPGCLPPKWLVDDRRAPNTLAATPAPTRTK